MMSPFMLWDFAKQRQGDVLQAAAAERRAREAEEQRASGGLPPEDTAQDPKSANGA